MKALILGAGQGSRLLPLTADQPKCLLPVCGRSMIEWQVRELAAAGIGEIGVVIGFRAQSVEQELTRLAALGSTIRTVYNPFFRVADNLASCWLAREFMDEDFILVNGDVVFESAIAERLVSNASAPVTVTSDCRDAYDADDMKLRLGGERVLEIGKKIPLPKVDAEAIGMHCFRGDGPHLFVEALDRAMYTPAGLEGWYTQVIDTLAQHGEVGSVSIAGCDWGEVDFPADLEAVRSMVAKWDSAQQREASGDVALPAT